MERRCAIGYSGPGGQDSDARPNVTAARTAPSTGETDPRRPEGDEGHAHAHRLRSDEIGCVVGLGSLAGFLAGPAPAGFAGGSAWARASDGSRMSGGARAANERGPGLDARSDAAPRTANSSHEAREIAPDVWCLGPKGRTQTNVYFVASGSSWTLIDAGWAGDTSAIEQAAGHIFGAGQGPTSILLTHVHPDHAGAARALAQRWNCGVIVPNEELAIANGSFAAMAEAAGPLDAWFVLPLMRAVGRRRREAIINRSSLRDVARAATGSGIEGLPGWESIPTPGHTPGHASFFRRADRVLLSGDAVVTLLVNSWSGLLLGRQGQSGPPWYTTWSQRTARASVGILAGLEPSVLGSGHGEPLVGPATGAALRGLADRLRRER